MNATGRQTAPPPDEVVLVTFRPCVCILEAICCGSETLCSAFSLSTRIRRLLNSKANVYRHLPTELVSTASISRGLSSPMVAPA